MSQLSNQEVVAACINFKNYSSFTINALFQNPLYLDQTNYRYFLKLLNVAFSNVIPNITEDQSMNNTIFATAGIYEISDLIKAFNNAFQGLEMSINANTGKIEIKNNDANDYTINSGTLTSEVYGFDFTYPVVIEAGSSIQASHVVKISTSNFFNLTSSTFGASSFDQTEDNGILIPTNTLYSFSSAMGAFQFKNWTAVEEVSYPLTMDILQSVNFELTDENGKELQTIPGASTDFKIIARIVRQKRI